MVILITLVHEEILSVSKIKVASIDKIKEKIENFKRNYESLKKDSSNEFKTIDINFDDIIKLDVNLDPLVQIEDKCKKYISKLENLLDIQNPESLSYKKLKLENELNAFQSSLSASQKSYQSYIDEIAQWNSRRDEIIGSENQLNSLKYFDNLLKKSMTIAPKELRNAKEERSQKVKDIYSQLKRLVDIYKDLYKPVQKFIDEHELIKNKYKLNFDVSITEVGFIETFLSYINQSVKGTFHGAQDGREKLRILLDSYDFNEESSVLLYLDTVISSLETDKRDSKERPIKLLSQLKKGIKREALYDYLYSLEFLEPKYMLQLGGKELLQLSPGERGVLLLIFYLLVDKEDCPLIIDQPEDNLDNQSVFELVAPCIREARLRRQLFIVTHNPNLAVVCDAEQVIAASIDKVNKERVAYISGAIENPIINRKIIDILEGTKPAFKKRESKYFLFAADTSGK